MAAPSPQRAGDGRERALIIGGGIMGMCVADVLARHYRQVTIIERDRLPVGGAEGRRGVPQGAQPNAVQVVGRQKLEAQFPGLLGRLRAAGAVEFDASRVARFGADGWLPRYGPLGLSLLACSRPLLENTLRAQLRERRPNVETLEGVRVTGLLREHSAEGVRVCGVTTDGAGAETLRAALVVDAAGRGSRAPRWIEAMGLPAPQEQLVNSFSNYASRRYRMPPDAEQRWWRTMIIDALPPDQRRAGVLAPIEDHTWLVTAVGINRDYAPTDEREWLEFLASLRSPMIARALEGAEPLGDIVQNRTMTCRWRRMDRYDAPLEGYLLAGDVLCTFNPSYGQGITGAALAAEALAEALAGAGGRVDRRVARRFYRSAARFQREGWDYSTGMDLRWPETEGARPPLFGLQQWGARQLERVAVHDESMVRVITRLFDFGANRWSILSPGFVGRFWWGLARSALRPRALAGPEEFDLYEPIEEHPRLLAGSPAS